MSASNAIEIRNLTKFYKNFKALDGISFEVKEGDFFGFLGPNGAGKTTTINVLTGLANLNQGSVRVFGYDVIRQYRNSRALIGLAPQEFNFDPFLTIEQILIYEAGYFGVPKRQAKRRAEELMETFELTAFRRLDFRKLSGGFKRRLLIARALVHDPKILIVDEPTAGLDIELRYKLWDFLRETNKKGITIFLTTHYIEEAEKLCNRIGVIQEGKIVMVDDKTALMERMSRNIIEVRVDRKFKQFPEELSGLGLEVDDRENTFRLRDQEGALSTLLKTIHAHGIEVLGVHMKKTTLEEIFFQLTRKKDENGE